LSACWKNLTLRTDDLQSGHFSGLQGFYPALPALRLLAGFGRHFRLVRG
jgi:hypothetical protein